MKKNKTSMIQARCTVEEVRKIDKAAAKLGIKRSDYIRKMLCHNGKGKFQIPEMLLLVIKVQEILNYFLEKHPVGDKTLERKVDELRKML